MTVVVIRPLLDVLVKDNHHDIQPALRCRADWSGTLRYDFYNRRRTSHVFFSKQIFEEPCKRWRKDKTKVQFPSSTSLPECKAFSVERKPGQMSCWMMSNHPFLANQRWLQDSIWLLLVNYSLELHSYSLELHSFQGFFLWHLLRFQ